MNHLEGSKNRNGMVLGGTAEKRTHGLNVPRPVHAARYYYWVFVSPQYNMDRTEI